MAKLDSTHKEFLKEREEWSPIWIKFINAYSGVSDQLPTLKRIVKKYEHKLALLHVSVFKPGAELSPHEGVSMGVWRYHYGLDIPDNGDLGMNVHGQYYRWKNRKSILWDDTLSHSSWNKTDNVRLIIFADVYRSFNGIDDHINRFIHKNLHHSKHVKSIIEKIEKDGKSFN